MKRIVSIAITVRPGDEAESIALAMLEAVSALGLTDTVTAMIGPFPDRYTYPTWQPFTIEVRGYVGVPEAARLAQDACHQVIATACGVHP